MFWGWGLDGVLVYGAYSSNATLSGDGVILGASQHPKDVLLLVSFEE